MPLGFLVFHLNIQENTHDERRETSMSWIYLLKAKDVDYDTTSVKIYYRVIPNGQWKQWDETDDRLTSRYFAFGALKYEARVHLKGELKGGNKKGIIHGKDATIQYVILDRKEPAP